MKYWQANLYCYKSQRTVTKENTGYYFTTEDVGHTEKYLCSYVDICACFLMIKLISNKSYYIICDHCISTQKLFFLRLLLFSVTSVSHRPSSNPTQMLAPIPEGALWTPASSSSAWEGSGTYSRHRTAEPTCRLFTALGMGLLRENISICPWEPSPPPATCRGEKSLDERGWEPMLSCTNGLNQNAEGNKLFCPNRKKKR